MGAAQVGETEPFISELLTGLTATIQDLETHQIHMFYEAVGGMVAADTGEPALLVNACAGPCLPAAGWPDLDAPPLLRPGAACLQMRGAAKSTSRG